MAGHSKWANIKHRKAHADARRGKVFTRLIKEITVATKLGGGDANANPRLRLALEKARAENMPSDNVTRAIRRGTGDLEGVEYQEIRYEGYGPGGMAIVVDCLTDNRTRTVADVRHAFSKHGGNLGQENSVSFLFTHCGQLLFAPSVDADALMDASINAGADDVITHTDGSVEVLCQTADLGRVSQALVKFSPEEVAAVMRPQNEITLSVNDSQQAQKLLDALDALDDVQQVYTNSVLSD